MAYAYLLFYLCHNVTVIISQILTNIISILNK